MNFQVLVWRFVCRGYMGRHRTPWRQWELYKEPDTVQLCKRFPDKVRWAGKFPPFFGIHLLLRRGQQERCLYPCELRSLQSRPSKSLQLHLLQGEPDWYPEPEPFFPTFRSFQFESSIQQFGAHCCHLVVCPPSPRPALGTSPAEIVMQHYYFFSGKWCNITWWSVLLLLGFYESWFWRFSQCSWEKLYPIEIFSNHRWYDFFCKSTLS